MSILRVLGRLAYPAGRRLSDVVRELRDSRPVRSAHFRTSRMSQMLPDFNTRTGAGKSGWRIFH